MTDCKIWHGARSAAGYGQKRIGGKLWYVHRLAFWWWYQIDPSGMFVCHKCDNPSCYNPSHLFIGTPADNMADCSRKGRVRNRPFPGSSNPAAKLTEEQVLSILSEANEPSANMAEIGRSYGINRHMVRFIKTGVKWSSVTGVKAPPAKTVPSVNLVPAPHI